MPFRLKKSESVQKAVRRLGRRCLARAREHLKAGPDERAVHSARTEIKKARALLRLVRSSMGRREYRRLARPLRKIGRILGIQRDASIRGEILEKLKREIAAGPARESLRAARRLVARQQPAAPRLFQMRRNRRGLFAQFARVPGLWADLKVAGDGWKILARGIGETYRAGRSAARKTRRGSDPTANLHEWRKRAKDLALQLKLLEGSEPEAMREMVRKLSALADVLGEIHDFMMVRDFLVKSGQGRPRDHDFKMLRREILRRERRLLRPAAQMGGKFYLETPAAFGRRLRGYWRKWQEG